MRTSIMIGEVRGPATAADLRDQAAAATGLDGIWAAQALGWDALTALTMAAAQAPDLSLGTAVVPIRQRHPLVLASQALSVQAATGGRLTLGVGTGIGAMTTGMFGLPADHAARYLREYLDILLPLLRGDPVTHSGEFFTLSGTVHLPTDPPEVLVAALSPRLLHLAGSRTAGTVTWMAGPRTLESHVVPRVTAAAGSAGRPAPRIVAALPVCVTNDPGAARDHVAARFGMAAHVPEYRAVLDREHVPGPQDVALIGDEREVTAALGRLAATGITEFAAAPVGTLAEQHRTTELLRSA
ncbi:TIGR03564 family F420-dependent LLM class oxidoreductase [Actinoplanes sp. CA-252034]|uniref:TIGR03564 family F420-dependent LLM class oxidoreductase n=1 Tax=Actinoplanes sp. CA-252034 TaxID=3239906 RepID=UPI003D9869D0